MKSLQEIEKDFISNLRSTYLNPSQMNPKGSATYIQEFLSLTGIDKLSPNKLTDISTPIEKVSNYLLTRKSDIHSKQDIDNKYIESYNAAFFIKFLNKELLNNITTNRKIFQSYDSLKNNPNATFGVLINTIVKNLGDTDNTIITYADLSNGLKDKLIDDYFAHTSQSNPIENKALFKNLITSLGIDNIKDVKIKDKVASIAGSRDILNNTIKPQDSFSVNGSDLSFLYFLVLYKFISIAIMIPKGRGLFRLPSELTKCQNSQIQGNITESDLTVQNVLDMWNQGYNTYIDNKRFKLSDFGRLVAIGSVIGCTYYVLRNITK